MANGHVSRSFLNMHRRTVWSNEGSMYESSFIFFELEASPTGLIRSVENLIVGLDDVPGHRGLHLVSFLNCGANIFPAGGFPGFLPHAPPAYT